MNRNNEPEPLRFLRLDAVMQLTGVKKSTLYGLMSEGVFPSQHKLSNRSVAWLDHEVQAWIESRVRASRGDARGAQ